VATRYPLLQVCGFGKVRTADPKNGGPRYTSSGAHRWKSRRAGVRALRYQSKAYGTVSVAVPLTLPAVAVMVTVPAAIVAQTSAFEVCGSSLASPSRT